MINDTLRLKYVFLILICFLAFLQDAVCQNVSSANSSYSNYTDTNGLRQGHWVITSKERPEKKEYPPGKKIEEGNYQNNLKSGEWTEYYPDGKVKSVIFFKAGKPNGTAVMFDTNGVLSETGFWDNRGWIGNYNLYYPSGQLRQQYTFSEQRKRIGRQIYYHSNGLIAFLYYMKNGKYISPAYEFDSTGLLIRRIIYDSLEMHRIRFEYDTKGNCTGQFKELKKGENKLRAGESIWAASSVIDSSILSTDYPAIDSVNIRFVKNENAHIFRINNLKKAQIELAVKNEKLATEAKVRYIFIVGSVLLACLLILFINRLRVAIKQNRVIQSQKKLIEDNRKEILESINYSKKIQTALLPELNTISNNLQDYFILYRPKDIVSGDFYYFKEHHNSIFIAAADCTGHGVPGAFMSLIGTKELSVANSFSDSPGQILKLLSNGIRSTLKQDQVDASRDGMDIALVRINNRTVTFSGANRPFWLIRNSSTDLEETKATKTAIGGFTPDNQNFSEFTFELSGGDSFYIFTDGFADQFGGEKQKKMGTKRFREVLLQIRSMTMEKQGIYLKEYIDSWRGNNDQVDDILVIGIRL